MNYSNLVKGTYVGLDGGYKNGFWFTKIDDVSAWGRPLATPLAVGDDVKITTAHTWADGKAANKWDVKLHSVKITGQPVGDPGAQKMEWTLEVVVRGDNAVILSMVKQMQNDDLVIWVKDANCIDNNTYIQLGNDCVPVEVAPNFDSQTTATGEKQYTIQFKNQHRYFYTGVLDTEFEEVEP